jgi:hypothetical protein
MEMGSDLVVIMVVEAGYGIFLRMLVQRWTRMTFLGEGFMVNLFLCEGFEFLQ